MTERADRRWVMWVRGDHEWHESNQLTDAEALSVLFPDVDWEALRRMLEAWPNPEALTPLQRMAHDDFLRHLARRLLAVYDGKDTP